MDRGEKVNDEDFTAEERAALKERAAEARAAKRGSKKDTEPEVLEKIASLPDEDRRIAAAIHEIVKEAAPALKARLWYGMPAYADTGGRVVCFVQPASKFKVRYSTLGFNDAARLDEGAMWPTAYAITRLGKEQRRHVAGLVRRAVGE